MRGLFKITVRKLTKMKETNCFFQFCDVSTVFMTNIKKAVFYLHIMTTALKHPNY